MKTVTKWCKRCGKIMWDVDPHKRFCDKCVHQKELERNRKRRAEYALTKKPKIKPISQCIKEAQKLGIEYGEYVSRGFDKVVIK